MGFNQHFDAYEDEDDYGSEECVYEVRLFNQKVHSD